MSAAVLIMARAPRPGACKTRLEPLLGPDGCAALQAELIRHTAGWTAATGRPVWLAHDPSDAGAELTALVPPSVRRFPQRGADLGQRLEDAVARVASVHAGPVIVVGTDCPLLAARDLDALETALVGGWDACLLGARDGGYVALALARPLPAAFGLAADAWGGPEVLDRTLALLRRQGCSAAVLDTLPDLDTPEDAMALTADPACPRAVREALVPDLEHA